MKTTSLAVMITWQCSHDLLSICSRSFRVEQKVVKEICMCTICVIVMDLDSWLNLPN